MKTITRSTEAMGAFLIGFLMLCSSTAAPAMTIKEFRKFTTTDQSMYIGAAVNMLAFTYAANGDTGKASCIKNWYFGTRGVDTPGPHEITIEMGVAENLDAVKYHVEGVILGVTDKACGGAAKSRP